MNLKKILKQLVVVLPIFIVLAVLLYLVQDRMNGLRQKHQLTENINEMENAPPMVAFTTVALGAFRGLVADWLWLRAGKMQDEGKNYELYQLSEWIVNLQPRYTAATSYLAWNMAYNVSVTCTEHSDRWRWVMNGVELIRDKAIIYNPSDPELYQQLGWIYQHKMGANLDDANHYYKRQLIKDMEAVMGDDFVNWQEFADAPATERELWVALGGENNEIKIELKRVKKTFANIEKLFHTNKKQYQKILQNLEPFFKKNPKKKRIFELCMRRRWLKDVYKLDVKRIVDINKKYGELEWKLPEAHAIYWASIGIEMANKKNMAKAAKSCDRMIFQSLKDAMIAGRILSIKYLDTIQFAPNLAVVDVLNDCYANMETKYSKSMVKAAYPNFLKDAIVQLFLNGEKKKAKKYQKILQKKFAKGPQHRYYYWKLEEFAMFELAGDVSSLNEKQTQSAIVGYIQQACFAVINEDEEQAQTLITLATLIYKKYMDAIGEKTKVRRKLTPVRISINLVVNSTIKYLQKNSKKEAADILYTQKEIIGWTQDAQNKIDEMKQDTGINP